MGKEQVPRALLSRGDLLYFGPPVADHQGQVNRQRIWELPHQ